MSSMKGVLVAVILASLVAYMIGSLYPVPVGIPGITTGSPGAAASTVTTTVTETMWKTTTYTNTLTSIAFQTLVSTTTVTTTLTEYSVSTIILAEGPGLTRVEVVIPSFRQADSGGELMLAGRYLALRYASWRPFIAVCEANTNTTCMYLTPFQVKGPAVYAKLLSYDGFYYTELYDVAEVVAGISSMGMAKPILLFKAADGWSCSLTASSQSAVTIANCSRVSLNVGPAKGMSMIEAVVRYVNSTSISYVSSILYQSGSEPSLPNATWRVLQWLDENASYDYDKAASNSTYIYDPITFATLKKGICTDYALFTATALVNISWDVYILVFNTTNGGHAVAGVVVNGGFFILDQHLPPVEVDDYFRDLESFIGGSLNSDIFLHRIWLENGSLRLLMTRVSLGDLARLYPDTNPADGLTQAFASELVNVFKALGRYNPGAGSQVCVDFTWPGFKYYSDALAKQYAVYVAEKVLQQGGSIIVSSVALTDQYTVRICYR